jgi:hypothetical protein
MLLDMRRKGAAVIRPQHFPSCGEYNPAAYCIDPGGRYNIAGLYDLSAAFVLAVRNLQLRPNDFVIGGEN